MDLNFWSSVFGLLGTILIFFFGLPPRINEKGHINLILEQVDNDQIKKYKKYGILNYLGLFFLALSFLIQIIYIFI